QVYVNERFVPAGAASLRLYKVARPRPPVAATDELGNDLLPALRVQDDVYAANSRPARYRGLTELHDLVLDFGGLAGMDSVFLFLTGWIRTNMEIYWDRAFVAATASASPVTVTTLRPVAADLYYRGFSCMYRKGGRYGPQWYDYGDVSRERAWAPIVGSFTRYGDVLPLV